MGVEQGIVLAIVLSVIDHLRRSYDPRNAVLGGGGGHDWHGLPIEPVPQPAPGLVVYRWGASLYFANATRFEEQVTGLAAPGVRPVNGSASIPPPSGTSTTRAARRSSTSAASWAHAGSGSCSRASPSPCAESSTAPA